MNEELDLTGIPTEDDLEGRSIPDEGAYHLGIQSWKPTDSGGKQITFTVLAGTVAEQEKKTFNEFFNAPSAKHKDGGVFMLKRLTKLALSAGLIGVNDLGKKVVINWDQLAGKQLLAYVVHETSEKDGKKYTNARIDGLEMFRCNDPTAQHIPKNERALAMLPPDLRPGAGQPQPATQTPATQPPAAPPATQQTTQAATTATPAQSKDPWADL